MFDYFPLKARLFESECQAIILSCQKWRPLKKKGQNVSFRELKDEKGRVDSPVRVTIDLKSGKIKANQVCF